MQIFIHPCCVK